MARAPRGGNGINHQTSRRRRALLACVAGGAVIGGATHALAQTPTGAAASPNTNAATLGEVVVTAQKRAQYLQEVPIAVTAVTQETLKANRVTSLIDLTGLAPGFTARVITGGLGSPQFTMRGIFASTSVAGQDREITVYLDGVYLGGNLGAIFDLPDIESVQVLRGPQGTLFGRNSTAGAVVVTTRNPTGKFKMVQEFTGGNYDQFRSRTSIDSPQWGPLSAYFTYLHDEKPGDVRNLGAGVTFDHCRGGSWR